MDSLDGNLFYRPMSNSKLYEFVKDTRLGKYYLENLDNYYLMEIMEKVWDYNGEMIELDNNRILTICYKLIIEKGLISVIDNIIQGLNDDDEISIYIATVKLDNINIIDLLLQKKFNLDQYSKINIKISIDLLCYAFMYGTLEMIDYLIDNGAKITVKNSLIYIKSCKNNDYMEKLLRIDFTDNKILNVVMSVLAKEKYIPTLLKFIEKGYSIKDNSKYWHVHLAYRDISILKIFLENGLVLDSSYPLLCACHNNNIPLVEFYLEYGLKVNEEILDFVMKNINLPIIYLFAKHHVDFSKVKNENSKYNNYLITLLENCGMNKDIFISLMINQITKLQLNNKTMDYTLEKSIFEKEEEYINS